MKKKKRVPLYGLMVQRKKAGMSQLELADALGVARNTVHHYESGARVPSDEMRQKIAGVLECSVKDIK